MVALSDWPTLTWVRSTAVKIAHNANCKWRRWETARLSTAETITLKLSRNSTGCAAIQSRSQAQARPMCLILAGAAGNVNGGTPVLPCFVHFGGEDARRVHVDVACA